MTDNFYERRPPSDECYKLADKYLSEHSLPDRESLAQLLQHLKSAAWWLGGKAERERHRSAGNQA